MGAVQTRGGGELRQYEVMLILPAEADESVVSGALDRITGIVSEGGGEVGNVDRWGRRRLAYEIDRQNEGYYVVAEFRADPAVITPLERALHLADDVLRFKVIVREDKAKASAKAEAAAAASQ
ncbi:MAG: 30S ribosomal protein S6 [Actinomycetota bacterium]